MGAYTDTIINCRDRPAPTHRELHGLVPEHTAMLRATAHSDGGTHTADGEGVIPRPPALLVTRNAVQGFWEGKTKSVADRER